MITKQDRYQFRKARVRSNLLAAGLSKPRLAVYRSDRYIYAQVIDDNSGKTLACASTAAKELKEKVKSSKKSVEAAKILGETIASKAMAAGVKEVCFDRAGRLYHGRIKALADAARKAGLKF